MAASGASAAIAGAATVAFGTAVSAAMVTTITTVAFAVTGISAKINEAASKVFGEDLVQIGNIFGAAYGAFTGGTFGLEGASPGIDAAATAGDYVNQMDAASDAAFNLSDVAGVTPDASAALASQADAIPQMGGDADGFLRSASAEPASAAAPQASTLDVRQIAAETQKPVDLIKASQPEAAPASAVTPQAAAPVRLQGNAAGTNAAANVQAPTAPSQRSFFDRLVYDEKGNVSSGAMRMGGQVLSGIGQGYVAGQKAKEDQRQFDAKMGMYDQRTGLRLTR